MTFLVLTENASMHSKKSSAYFEAESFISDRCSIGEEDGVLEEKVKKPPKCVFSDCYISRFSILAV